LKPVAKFELPIGTGNESENRSEIINAMVSGPQHQAGSPRSQQVPDCQSISRRPAQVFFLSRKLATGAFSRFY
jgi:hypothetical protein